MNSVKSICDNFDSLPEKVKEDLLLYGDSRFDENKNRVILKATISYMKNTERFSGLLINIQLLTYNSDHSVLKPYQLLLEFSILNFDFPPTT